MNPTSKTGIWAYFLYFLTVFLYFCLIARRLFVPRPPNFFQSGLALKVNYFGLKVNYFGLKVGQVDYFGLKVRQVTADFGCGEGYYYQKIFALLILRRGSQRGKKMG